MGIDIHCFNFLRYAQKKHRFDRTVTIGRQSVHVTERFARKALPAGEHYRHLPYCEELLQKIFGATSVDSVDASNYEQASIIHDMNEPLPPPLHARFDTVIDGGSLEHVYNAPQGLRNCSLLCRPRGQIIHVLPANNFCGHGFWQFSPELFYSLYSRQHGYAETEVFLADLGDRGSWFKVLPPAGGQRVNVHSRNEVYALVRTVLSAAEFSQEKVQQSDYLYYWLNSGLNPSPHTHSAALKQRIKNSPILSKLCWPPFRLYLHFKNAAARSRMKLSKANPGLEKVLVSRLLQS